MIGVDDCWHQSEEKVGLLRMQEGLQHLAIEGVIGWRVDCKGCTTMIRCAVSKEEVMLEHVRMLASSCPGCAGDLLRVAAVSKWCINCMPILNVLAAGLREARPWAGTLWMCWSLNTLLYYECERGNMFNTQVCL